MCIYYDVMITSFLEGINELCHQLLACSTCRALGLPACV